MKPYFEFYSDIDRLMKSLEEIIEKCHNWWLRDEPFSEKEPISAIWYELEDALTDIQDKLNDEPFFQKRRLAMNQVWKNIILLGIVEDYAKRHGIQQIDWNLSYFAQPMNVISCIDDIAVVVNQKGNSKGWPRSHVLYERCVKTIDKLLPF